MERLWGTLQGLPQVLRLEEISTIEAANRFWPRPTWPTTTPGQVVAAAEEGTACAFVGDLAGVLCSKHAR